MFGDNPDDSADVLALLGDPPHVIKLNEGSQGTGVVLLLNALIGGLKRWRASPRALSWLLILPEWRPPEQTALVEKGQKLPGSPDCVIS